MFAVNYLTVHTHKQKARECCYFLKVTRHTKENSGIKVMGVFLDKVGKILHKTKDANPSTHIKK